MRAVSTENPRSQAWENAFGKLTNEQRKILKDFGIDNTKSIKLEIETIECLKAGCTKNLTNNKKPTMTRARIHNILKKMQKYVVIVDIAIQHNPDITALVWAGLRFCLQVTERLHLSRNHCANYL